MNDLFVAVGCVCLSVVVVVAFVLYYQHRGMNDSLVDSTVGSVYNFRYFQPLTGTHDRVLAKVVRKYDLGSYINVLNRNSKYRKYDSSFQRTNTLVTCVLPDGSIRNFYAERCSNCKKSLFGKLLYTTGLACIF